MTVRQLDELEKMRRAGQVVAEMHETLRAAIRPGVTTAALDRIARDVLARRGARSNFLGYHGYPAVICASPNDVIVHGVPSDAIVLLEGDIVSIDCGAIIEGYHGDAAWTYPVGEISTEAQQLIDVAAASLFAGIDQLRVGNRLGDVGFAVQSVIEAGGFGVVRDYVGHGIGTSMHEPPEVPNFGRPNKGPRLQIGNVFAVEPMLTVGRPASYVLDDDWTVCTVDGSWAAHVEHTIAVGADGPEVLTAWR